MLASIGSKRALGAMPAAGLDAQRLARLKLTATTHQHLIRMLALSCIVSEPKRFGVELPAGDPDDLLIEVIPPAALDLRLAAAWPTSTWLKSSDSTPHGRARPVHMARPAGCCCRPNPPIGLTSCSRISQQTCWVTGTQLVDTATEFADLASSLGSLLMFSQSRIVLTKATGYSPDNCCCCQALSRQ